MLGILTFFYSWSRAAVQNERDRISCRRQSTDDPDPGNGLAVQSLLKAEMESRQSKAGAVLENTAVGDDLANKQLASINDVCESMKQQLLILVEWAKHIPAFNELQLDDQVCSKYIFVGFFSPQVITLSVSFRSGCTIASPCR